MSFTEFDEIEEYPLTQRNKWWWILKLLTTILTSILTVLGMASCGIAA